MNNLFSSVYDIGIVGRLIVLILIILSIIAWGIIIEKIILFSRTRRTSKKFFTLFQIYSDWYNIEKETRDCKPSPYLNLFRKLFAESQNDAQTNRSLTLFKDEDGAGDKLLAPLAIYKSLADSVISRELMPFEKRLVFLSSTVSASPFLGLFGTVWGVMQAFMSIGVKGSAAITAIGPGIAEALITTVVGLAVAISVLFAYNLTVDKIRKYENQLQILASDIIKQIVQGNIHGGSQI